MERSKNHRNMYGKDAETDGGNVNGNEDGGKKVVGRKRLEKYWGKKGKREPDKKDRRRKNGENRKWKIGEAERGGERDGGG